MSNPRCAGTGRDGTPCRSYALADSDRCWNHDPERAAAAAAARSAGGKARAKQQSEQRGAFELENWAALLYVEDVEDALAHIVTEVLAGRLGAREAAAAVRALEILMRQNEHGNRDRRPREANGHDGEDFVSTDLDDELPEAEGDA